MRDADWSRKTLLRSDWLGPKVAPYTTAVSELDILFTDWITTSITANNGEGLIDISTSICEANMLIFCLQFQEQSSGPSCSKADERLT